MVVFMSISTYMLGCQVAFLRPSEDQPSQSDAGSNRISFALLARFAL
jgi:hypothetical protein